MDKWVIATRNFKIKCLSATEELITLPIFKGEMLLFLGISSLNQTICYIVAFDSEHEPFIIKKDYAVLIEGRENAILESQKYKTS